MINAKQSQSGLRGIDGGTEYQHKLSFQSIPFKENLNEVDKKYTSGRFGYLQDDALEGSKVRTISALNDRRIPRVGLFSSSDQGISYCL